ncbi:hypothetical protein MKX01_000520 [Papaver californicum]|nr:hypothetical protein MKX01_000520 [Papaver californicum]
MADEKVEEKKIPVLTVLKKGSIVKNIYLDNLLIPGEYDSVLVGGEEEEVIFIVGRHPDCNIMLEHPSISRFHLKIYSKTSSKSHSVMDLSSAHGTWISDQKIEPQVRVDLNEGDTWSMKYFLKERRIILCLPMSENGNSSFVSDDDKEGVHNMMTVVREEVRESPLRSRAMGEESVYSSTLAAVESVVLETSPQQIDKENGTLQSLVEMSDVLSEIENQESPPMKSEKKFGTPNIWSRRGKSVGSIQIEITKSSIKKVDGSSKQDMEEEFTPDKENCTPKSALGMKLMRKEV